MKYIKIFLLCLLFILSYNLAFAGIEEETDEEKACFSILSDMVKNQDARFSGLDLSEVPIDGTTMDISSYEEFRNKRAINPKNANSTTDDKYRFEARRTNIGTIITENNFVISQIVGFGQASNFNFPLSKSDNGGTSEGDPYKLGTDGDFREYLVYTHHLLGGTFLSCGIVKIKPLGGYTFGSITESNYMTNTLNTQSGTCNSSFEGEKKSESGKEYYAMKVNMCAYDYEKEDFLKMEVISVAYNNHSDFLNEFETHPLQVKAMKNASQNPKGLVGVRDTFYEYIENETCLKIARKGSLPARCGHAQKKDFSILSFLIPTAHAALDVENVDEERKKMEEARGLVVYDNLPFRLYKKLGQIPDKTFVDYVKLALTPNLKQVIEHKKASGFLLSPYEETFLACDMGTQERTEVVIDFLEKLDAENFDTHNLTYLNKKFGDCIIPYPDKEHIDKVIENSFEINKMRAEVASGTYKETELPDDLKEYYQKMDAISEEYDKKLEDIDKKFQSQEIDSNQYNILLKELEKEQKENIQQLDETIEEQTMQAEQENKVKSDKSEKQNPVNKQLILAIVLMVVGLGIVVGFIIYRRKLKKD